MQKRIKSFDGTRINYDISRIRGNDNFLIFLHGAGANLTTWRDIRAFFHRIGVPTIAIDLRGHGKSDRPALLEEYNLENFAKDIYEIIKEEKVKGAILIGHSLGGMVAITFHKLYPKLSKSYIIISSSYKAPRLLKTIFKRFSFLVNFLNKFLKKIKLSGTKFSHLNEKIFKKTKDRNIFRIGWDMIKTSLKSWLFTFENITQFDGMDILKHIKKPVLILEGKEDTIINTEQAKRLHKMIKDSILKIIPKASHMIILTNPALLEKEIYDFIKHIHGFVKKKE